MDSRTRLAIGGMTTVVASIAVVCAVAMTTSSALADTAGATVDARPVVVPTASASPTPVPSPTATPAKMLVVVPTQPETVPAPEPEDVALPPTGASSAGEPSEAIEDHLAHEVRTSGSWDAVYEWAQNRDWPAARTDEWIARLEAKIAQNRANEDDRSSKSLGGEHLDSSRSDDSDDDDDGDDDD